MFDLHSAPADHSALRPQSKRILRFNNQAFIFFMRSASIKALFSRHLAPTAPDAPALEIAGGKGPFLYDSGGKRYLDLISGIAVSALGHSHPAIISAVKNQAEKHLHVMVYGEHVLHPQVRLATELTRLLPSKLDCVYFTNSGTEATEGAMKLCKRVTGKPKFIALNRAYHGSSQGALSLAGESWLQDAYRPLLPGVSRIIPEDFESLKQIDDQVAGVFIEPIQGEAGARVLSSAWLGAVRERCTEVGALLVYDEIQSGVGRTGQLWAWQHSGPAPDVLLLGKAFGGGMPLGAFVAPREMMLQLASSPILGHITTFGGHPLSCAAALASLKIIARPQVLRDVREKEQLVRRLFAEAGIPLSGMGLMLAIGNWPAPKVQDIIRRLRADGILADWFLYNPNAIRFAPPFVATKSQLAGACKKIISAALHQSE